MFSEDKWQCLDHCEASKLLLSLPYDQETSNNDHRDGGCYAADRMRDQTKSPDIKCAYRGMYV